MILSDEDYNTINYILRFYRDEVTHSNPEGYCGLEPKSKEYKLITTILKKLDKLQAKEQKLTKSRGKDE